MKTKTTSFWKHAACGAALFLSTPAFAKEAGTMPENWGTHLLAAASPVRERMVWFYEGLLTPVIIGISLFVLALLVWVIARYNAKANPVPSKTTHNTLLEVVWTLIPVLILVVISIPSMKILYYADRTADAEMTLKVTGYQWYWGYEYPDDGGISFLANIVKDKDLKDGEPRLLTTDNPVVLPVDTTVRILISASDVIHSWSVPPFGIKLDAVPGRVNETWVRATKTGTFYGQCSQLCGANHAFMPIEVKVVSKDDFVKWVHAQKGKTPEEMKAEKAAAEAKTAIPAKAGAKVKPPAAAKKQPNKK